MNSLRSLIHSVNPDVVFLMETKLSSQDMKGVWQRLGFNEGVAFSSAGVAGRVAFFWHVGWDINVVYLESDKIIISFNEDRNFKPWYGCFIYAPPKRADRDILEEPWILMGDINSILCQDDKVGGRPMTDMEGARALKIHERLDRVLCSTSWLSHFAKANTNNFLIRHSDHAPIVLDA
ncbi:hypothetical protein G4B88_001335 [Cannabis sativa]|uniref:Endonuclease/exonuclease/phosphatase domain-containing protein n=1 Tax=Cannabis sativa TaxID=3483 RepID=A0A7J6I2C6_CANSA|nr:hypothetical protein G4B88_001335 [Cannabis sativa]